MALTLVESSASISTAPRSLPADTTSGVPTSQTDDGHMQLMLDLNALTYGDEFRLKFYEKATAAAGQLLFASIPLIGLQQDSIYIAPAFILAHGWEMSLEKIAGGDRTIGWSIRKLTHGLTIVDMAQSVDGTEWSIPSDAAYSSGSPQTGDALVQVWADLTTMASGDRFQVRGWEKVNGTGATQRSFWHRQLVGVQTKPVVSPLITLANGWDATVQRLAGASARAIEASVRKVAVA